MFISKIFTVNFIVLLNTLSSLADIALVVDDSLSIANYLDYVKETCEEFVTFYTNEEIVDEDLILVTFNDPEVKLRVKTSNTTVFKEAIQALEPHNRDNFDCPEYSLSGVELALQESKPESYIFVITDASAKDYNKFDDIKQLCQKKDTIVDFSLGGDCNDRTAPGVTVYEKIEEACSIPDISDISDISDSRRKKRDVRNVMKKLKNTDMTKMNTETDKNLLF